MYNAHELVGRVGIVFSEAVVGDTSNKLRFFSGMEKSGISSAS